MELRGRVNLQIISRIKKCYAKVQQLERNHQLNNERVIEAEDLQHELRRLRAEHSKLTKDFDVLRSEKLMLKEKVMTLKESRNELVEMITKQKVEESNIQLEDDSLNIDQIISIMEEKEKGSTKVAELNYRIESLNSYIDILEKELAQEKKKNRECSLASLDTSNCRLNASFVSNGANGRESEGLATYPESMKILPEELDSAPPLDFYLFRIFKHSGTAKPRPLPAQKESKHTQTEPTVAETKPGENATPKKNDEIILSLGPNPESRTEFKMEFLEKAKYSFFTPNRSKEKGVSDHKSFKDISVPISELKSKDTPNGAELAQKSNKPKNFAAFAKSPIGWDNPENRKLTEDLNSSIDDWNRLSYKRVDLNQGIVEDVLDRPMMDDDVSRSILNILRKDSSRRLKKSVTNRKESFQLEESMDQTLTDIQLPHTATTGNKVNHSFVMAQRPDPEESRRSLHLKPKSGELDVSGLSDEEEGRKMYKKKDQDKKRSWMQKQKKQLNQFFERKKTEKEHNKFVYALSYIRDFSRDYLDLLKNKQITSYLQTNKTREDRIFSDSIFLYKKIYSKERYILMITCTVGG